MDLLMLAPEIQEEVLHLPLVGSGDDPVTMRELQAIARAIEWEEQRRQRINRRRKRVNSR
jgi:hypothetical protein